jgi:hypothetical protein
VAPLSALQPPISSRYHCRPSPCDRLSRTRTTTTAPSHPRPIGRRCAQPYRPRWRRDPGQTQGGSRVHLLIARRRRHPTRPLRHRRGYPAARHRGLPSVPPTCRGVPRLRDEGDRVRVASGPDPPGSSRCVFERRRTSVSRVCLSVTLATPAPSGSTGTPWLRQGRLPPTPAPPGARLPSASQSCCDRTTVQVSHLNSINKRLTAHRRSDASAGEGSSLR